MSSAAEVEWIFKAHFDKDLSDLKALFNNTNWKSASYGGNAWFNITTMIINLGAAIDKTDHETTDALLRELNLARHNTGKLTDKLQDLDHNLSCAE